jgi:pSer/pThr/pTyr-binding forkhead associated (FHA) protein
MYKYSCRKCIVRRRCIEQSKNAIGIKTMIRNAFEAQTDTLATWALLQKRCLIEIAEQERSKSALSDRLNQSRISPNGSVPAEPPPPVKPKKSRIRRLSPAQKPVQQSDLQRARTYEQNIERHRSVAGADDRRSLRPLKRLAPVRVSKGVMAKHYWLTIESTRRHIALPEAGRLVLGRFDPYVGIPPDVDLTFEDKNARLVSRRHAIIFGQNGQHTIEDLGSSSGILLNDRLVGNGPSQLLQAGDHLRLGSVQLLYEPVPAHILAGQSEEALRYRLLVTPTNRRLPVTPFHKIVIGRSDSRIEFRPDIDLSIDGDAAQLVSRRHALIQWKDGRPFLEDLGSRFGTRLGGELLAQGEAVPLQAGDHIWLGGCVLAYDIEL